MSIFSGAVSTILGAVQNLAGESVIYRRGDDLEIEIEKAVPLGGDRPRDTQGSYTLASDELEWGIARAALVDDDNEITPAEFDTIERTIGGRVLTYKVLPDERNHKRQCWKWSDRGQTQYRIFTKLDSNVAAD